MNPSRSILATLFVALLLVGCSEESMLTGPDSASSTSQVAPDFKSMTSPAPIIAASKGGKNGKTVVCHVPPGQDQSAAVQIEVSNAALDQHLNGHGDWVLSADDCSSGPIDEANFQAWKNFFEVDFSEQWIFSNTTFATQLSSAGADPGSGLTCSTIYISWDETQVTINTEGDDVGYTIDRSNPDDVRIDIATALAPYPFAGCNYAGQIGA